MKFVSSEQQDIVIDCIQWDSRLFPGGCKNQYAPEPYGFLLYTESMNTMNTVPQMANCNGGAISLKNQKAGSYIARIVNY